MFLNKLQSVGRVEILESRIAPATLIDPTGNVGKNIVSGAANSPIFVHAGETLSTSSTGGAFLLYVEQGTALVFSTDLNKNGSIDPNEITGIAASDGLRMISFVNIHGDVVTNLTNAGTLSDSDGNASNNDPRYKGDGRVLLNNSIELIELRSLTVSDLASDQNGDGVIDNNDVLARLAYSDYSIYGSIYAGKSFGTSDGANGLIIDTSGASLQTTKFDGTFSNYYYQQTTPTIGAIRVGTAASDQTFSFGASSLTALNVGGKISSFTPSTGQVGADINGIHSTSTGVIDDASSTAFNLDGLFAGNGGFGARGGNISNVVLGGDLAGGYKIYAGNGGDGFSGGVGGSITGFEDLGSSTTDVIIKSGNGGVGLTGKGGNGGTMSFGTMNLFANISIVAGDGGSGFKGGGDGSDLTTLNLTTGTSANSMPALITSTWRDPYSTGDGNLGRVLPIDFNGDGFGDFVYATTSPSQLAVMLSDGFPGFYTKIQLDLTGTPSAITVGDFNGDGKADIAVATSNVGGLSGISVFFSIWQDTNGDGKLDAFTGFSSQHFNPLPTLYDYPGLSAGAFAVSGQPITSLVSGDFNHDGVTDVAVSAVYYALGGAHKPFDVVLMLSGDANPAGSVTFEDNTVHAVTSGSLYADFSKDQSDPNSQGRIPFILIGEHKDSNPVILQAAGLQQGTDSDVLFYGVVGAKFLTEVDFSQLTLDVDNISQPSATVIALGKVDTNRTVVDDKGNPQTSSTDATLASFTVGDLDGDGNADVIAMSKAPLGYLIDWTGDGTGAFTKQSGDGNQAGIQLVNSDPKVIAPITDGNFTPQMLAITTGDANGSVIAVYGNTAGTVIEATVYALSLRNETYKNAPADPTPPGVSAGTLNQADIVSTQDLGTPPHNNASALPPFDVFRYDATDATQIGFTTLLDPDNTTNSPAEISTYTTFLNFSDLFNASIKIQAGNGGDSTIGQGGKGGSIGNGVSDSVTIDGSGIAAALISSNGFSLYAGNGGNGFSNGGAGGNISGLTVVYNLESQSDVIFTVGTYLYAGDGGSSIKATGGKGGDLSFLNVQDGVTFDAGNGGYGKSGGKGGSVIGKGDSTKTETNTTELDIGAGKGGDGITSGGAGGSVTNFIATLRLTGSGSEANYIAGAGGSAVSGMGGTGGSILNSSPSISTNGFSGALFLQAGDGGSGLTGGMGGSINTFNNSPTENTVPSIVTFIAGNGGIGISGNGGAGGSVSNVSATGKAYDANTDTALANMVIAGNGGDSYGARGGNGGGIVSANVSAVGGGIITAAGAGGNGLTKGGLGGSVSSTVVNASTNAAQGSGAKILILAGKGGDAYASTTSDIISLSNNLSLGWSGSLAQYLAFGGVHGVGADGGSITNLQQVGNPTAGVDLIAGNGGSTINYGSSDPSDTTYVGKGGSITSVNLTGTIGNIDHSVPIKSYSSTFITDMRDAAVNFTTPGFSDANGNVGLVAGAAGRVYGDNPAAQSTNGSVKNLTARAIMSMVAGSVDRVAAIQSAKNITVTLINGDFGSDKGTSGVLDYYDELGNPVNNFVPGGGLIDGAIFTLHPIVNSDGIIVTGSRVFSVLPS